MNDIERKLVELNEALLDLAAGNPVDEQLLETAKQVLSGKKIAINTGAGNDTIIINNSPDPDPDPPAPIGYTGSQGYVGSQGEQGPIGYIGSIGYVGSTGYTGSSGYVGSQGAQGPIGPSGECYCDCNVVLVDDDYTVMSDDYYVGVNSHHSVTITLPDDFEFPTEIIIKSEMGPPLGNRKIVIVVANGGTIENAGSYVITIPYGVVRLLWQGDEWFIVS